MVNLYTKDNCPQCMMTKRYLNDNHVTYNEINIDHHLDAKQYLLNHNILQVPVIEANNEFIIGFQPQRFKSLKGVE